MSFDRQTVKHLAKVLAVCAVTAVCVGAYAAGADLGQSTKQATNWTAIGMFGTFVAITLGVTKWAAARTRSAADFYTGGGGITGFQNGLAIAGDYMSAASFLGISGLVFASGFDGLPLEWEQQLLCAPSPRMHRRLCELRSKLLV